MTRPTTVEGKRLLAATKLIDEIVPSGAKSATDKLALLEAVSCRKSGILLEGYQGLLGLPSSLRFDEADVEALLQAVIDSGIPFSLALAALSRVEGTEVETKRNGAVYTDFRLAEYLAESALREYKEGCVIDPSCGTSIVLAACAERIRKSGGDVESFVSNCLYGVDLSELAIRGSLLALASYLHNLAELTSLVSHFLCADSLNLGSDLLDQFSLVGFSLVVGNPPWERVRPSRNEFAKDKGIVASYGTDIINLPPGYEEHRDASRARSLKLAKDYGLKGGMDLYRAFFNLSQDICLDGGGVCLYLPAGLIRSKTLGPTRKCMLDNFAFVSMSVFMNHSKFFSIDSRFKFVLATMMAKNLGPTQGSVEFRYCSADDDHVTVDSKILLDNKYFYDCSGSLGAPEVKTNNELDVLRSIWGHSLRMSEHPLFNGVHPLRELDMTLDRHLFRSSDEISDASRFYPLIEGRMISQFRCGCKVYQSGSGRSAKWRIAPLGGENIIPQFYVGKEDVNPTLANRAERSRIGYCDIAGQTNERAMQAALIPAGCVCGNKVPTIEFDDLDDANLWLGIVNSLVFDWVVRRYITTTINFFILENLPFPAIEKSDARAQSIIDGVKRINGLHGSSSWSADESWLYATERARLEALVLAAYGLSADALEVILADFPLIDRVNAELSDGVRPTIELVRYCVTKDDSSLELAKKAFGKGALPFVPNEHMRGVIK